MFTNIKALRKVGFSPLGFVCILATLVAVLYTTASDALVAPKLIWNKSNMIVMKAYALTSYSNVQFVKANCLLPDTLLADENNAGGCLEASLSGFCRSTPTSSLRHRAK